MAYVERKGAPTLCYKLDDYTDPWKNAPYMVLLHGFGRNSRFWYRWTPYLSRFYKVIRSDLRGLGQSGKDFVLDKLGVDCYLRDFNDLIDRLGIDSLHYCGDMSAGILGMAFAAEYPRRVRTLTVVSTPPYMTEEDKKSALCGCASRGEALRKLGSRALKDILIQLGFSK